MVIVVVVGVVVMLACADGDVFLDAIGMLGLVFRLGEVDELDCFAYAGTRPFVVMQAIPCVGSGMD